MFCRHTIKPLAAAAPAAWCNQFGRGLVNRYQTRGAAVASNQYGWNPFTNPAPPVWAPWINQREVVWPPFLSVEDWIKQLDMKAIAQGFRNDGFAVIPGILPVSLVPLYAELHDLMMTGRIDTKSRRDFFKGHMKQQLQGTEDVGLVQWPMDFVQSGREGPFHQRAYAICKELLGDDTAFDFDAAIWEDPHTIAEHPWQQDEAQSPHGMVDKRAITVSCAVDEATVDNGAMWFIKGSHNGPILPYETLEDSSVLPASGISETTPGAVCVNLPAGSAVLWHGRACHYARGNTTRHTRRTFLANFRPEMMVQWERERGFDHLRQAPSNVGLQQVPFEDAFYASESSTANGTLQRASHL